MSIKSARKRPNGRRPEASGTARERLLDAATMVFGVRGYRVASVEEVASAAGVTKAAAYWNFDSKEDLLFALIRERVDRRARELMGITAHATRDALATGIIALAIGLAQEHLADPESVPDDLVGEPLSLLHGGLTCWAEAGS